jgi:hypothetical protein
VSGLFLTSVLTLVAAQFVLPRRLAYLPLLLAAFHLPNVAVIEVLNLNFTICRLLLLAGLTRAVITRVLPRSSRSTTDGLFALWAGWAILSSLAHDSTNFNPLTMRLALAGELLGSYLYARAYVRDIGDVLRFAKALALTLIPLAVFMVYEKAGATNLYAAVGAFEEVEIRNGAVRAAGPFAHPILAGTAAATSIPIVLMFFRQNRRLTYVGVAACLTIVISSASSGPIMTLLAAMFGFALWPCRKYLSSIRLAILICIAGLQLFMSAPVWYLMARVNLTGGSTGWHRAELITQALNHLGEWWWAGTDFTRHWMPYGVTWTDQHADITNFYLKLGIYGGLPLMLTFIGILIAAFRGLGRTMRTLRINHDSDEFVLWCLGTTLFANSVTFLSISYFDQTCVLFGFLLGIISPLSTIGNVKESDSETARQSGMAAQNAAALW